MSFAFLRTKRTLLAVAVLCAVGLVVSGLAMKFTPSYDRSDSINPLMLAELTSLRGENALIVRPSVDAIGEPSIYVSAHGLPVLALAGAKPRLNWDSAVARQLVDQAIKSDPLWSRVYLLRLAQATGAQPRAEWLVDLGINVREMLDRPVPADSDKVSGIVEIAAATQVIAASGMRDTALQESLAAWLTTYSAGEQSAFAICSAARALRSLGIDPAGVLSRPTGEIPNPRSGGKQLLDAFGWACLTRVWPDMMDDRSRRDLRSQLDSFAHRKNVADFDLYHAISASFELGSDGIAWSGTVKALTERLDPDTGLLREIVIRFGTLDGTYQASRIVGDIGTREVVGDGGITTLASELPKAKTPCDALRLSIVLARAGVGQPEAARRAYEALSTRLSTPVDRSSLAVVAECLQIVRELGMELPRFTIAVFPVDTPEDRYLAWLALGLPAAANVDEIRRNFAQARGIAAELLTSDFRTLSVKEFMAAVSAVNLSADERNRLAPLWGAWVDSLLGCKGFTQLYRPSGSATRCDLRATADMMSLGLGGSIERLYADK